MQCLKYENMNIITLKRKIFFHFTEDLLGILHILYFGVPSSITWSIHAAFLHSSDYGPVLWASLMALGRELHPLRSRVEHCLMNKVQLFDTSTLKAGP